MRNLKKILALVLAMVMAFSVMSVAGAFSDDDKFDGSYDEAAKVLAGMSVFQGYPDETFRPEQTITRAETAALIYRIATGDVYDANVALYKYQGKFTDVAADHWAAGYINYCANAEYIRGTSATTFDPEAKVTGYQVLAMILRAVGYDANKEFTGNDWEIQVARVANDLQITGSVAGISLRDAAPRQIVAELLFRTLVFAPIVKYTAALGYQPVVTTPVVDITAGTTTLKVGGQTLGQKVFSLKKGERTTIDKWGRPGYTWTYTAGNYATTIAEPYFAQYTTAVAECKIAADTYVSGVVDLYTNGKNNKTSYDVQPLDTVQTIGAQGTLTEVYWDRIVTIDTFLAQVTDVKDATYDAAGHLKTEATITLCVYDLPTVTAVNQTKTTANLAEGQTVVLTNGATNYTYAKGNMVLINAWTKNTPNLTTGDVRVDTVSIDAAKGANRAEYAKILGLAKTMEGAQTFLWYNAKQHTVDGVNYNDAKWFKLDQAGKDTSKYTWYFDQYDNLIGSTAIATQYTYGIIESIQWQNPVMDYGYAQAIIRYMDGTTETKVVSDIDGKDLTYTTTDVEPSFANGTISTSLAENAAECGKDLFRIFTYSDGTLSMVHVNHLETATATTPVKSHLDNATIKGNATTTALAAITGTVPSGSSCSHSVIYANSNTTFLVNNGGSYTVVKGYENMASYTGTATVDWVNLDGDSYADFVYVCGTPDVANNRGLFYLTNANVKAVLAGGSVAYYVIEGYADGVFGEIKLAGNAGFYWDNGTNNSIATLTEAQIEALLRAYVNEMFVVEYKGGMVTQMWGPKNFDVPNLATETTIGTKVNLAYVGTALDYQAASATVGTITKNGNVLKVGNAYYNVIGMTTTVNGYAWGEVEDLSGKNVYVIYDTVNTLNGTYVAKAVYVADPADGSTDSGEGEAPAPAPVATDITIKSDKSVYMNLSGDAEVGDTYEFELYKLDSEGYVLVGKFNATVQGNTKAAWVDMSSVIIAGSGTYKAVCGSLENVATF